jgi:uronate dehydrogenase
MLKPSDAIGYEFSTTMKSIILSGASGNLGRRLADELAARGHRLLLFDIADYPDPLPRNASFRRIDLTDRKAVLGLAPKTQAILHLGGISDERSFDEILGPNLCGTYHVFELARLAKARVIFASSNHVIGFHERGRMLDENCELRPDSFYGLSKAYGELLARLYWAKHAVESLSIRIGTCLPEPKELRHLSTWLSHADLLRMVEAGLHAPNLGCRVIWGGSQNQRSWWRSHDKDLGDLRRDNAELFAAMITEPQSRDPVVERYQGGDLCAHQYSRHDISPDDVQVRRSGRKRQGDDQADENDDGQGDQLDQTDQDNDNAGQTDDGEATKTIRRKCVD